MKGGKAPTVLSDAPGDPLPRKWAGCCVAPGAITRAYSESLFFSTGARKPCESILMELPLVSSLGQEIFCHLQGRDFRDLAHMS